MATAVSFLPAQPIEQLSMIIVPASADAARTRTRTNSAISKQTFCSGGWTCGKRMNIPVATEAFAKGMRQIDLFRRCDLGLAFPALSPLRRLGTPGPWNLCL
jgi:hypothetical protein